MSPLELSPRRERRRTYRMPVSGLVARLTVVRTVSTPDGLIAIPEPLIHGLEVTPLDASAGGALLLLPADAPMVRMGTRVLIDLSDEGFGIVRQGSVVREDLREQRHHVAIRFDPEDTPNALPARYWRVFNRRTALRATPRRPTPVDVAPWPTEPWWRSFVTGRLIDASVTGLALVLPNAHASRLQQAEVLSLRVHFGADPAPLVGEVVARTRLGVHERLGLRLIFEGTVPSQAARNQLRDWVMHRLYLDDWNPGPMGVV